MGGGTQTSTGMSIAIKDPWSPAIPTLKTALSGAQNAYDTTYQGPQVAALDPNVTAGQNAVLANSANGLVSGNARDALSGLQGVLGNGGLSALQYLGANGYLSGQNQLGQVASNLSPMASGAYLDPSRDPNFVSAVKDALNQTGNQIGGQFASAGRYGSGAMADTLARQLGQQATNAYANQYNQNVSNMLGANSQLQGVASGYGGMGSGLAGIGQTGVSNLAGAGGALSGLATAQNTDAANQMGVGGQRMDYLQQLIDSANQAPWARVGNLAQIAGGIGGLGGTSVGMNQNQTQTSGGIGQVLGGVLGGIGSLANIGKGIGGFASLFSDRRLKENIRKVGKTDDGQNIYAYNYKSDPMKRRTLGLMAQEVEKVRPQAVTRDPTSGYRMVDYGIATGAA